MKNLILILCISISGKICAQDTTRLSLLFVGDIMGHDSQIASAYEPATKTYDYTSCFKYIKPYLETPDLTIGNLEVTLAGPPLKGYPQFSSPDALAKTLKDVGFDVLVTSNNHCVDRGRKGLERTIAMLDSFKIEHTGTFVDTVSRMNDYPMILEKNGFRLALLNYTFSTNGLPVYKPNIVNRLDTAVMRKDLKKAKEFNPDAIIVFTHWGVEYQSLPGKKEKDLTEFCFKHGATLVIGAHPHVIQPMEWRKEKNQFVAYSLGNFVSGQRKRYTDGGAMAYLELEKVQYKPDSSVTKIDSAGYYLQWMYKTVDAKKDYYILPEPTMQENPSPPGMDGQWIIADYPSFAAYNVFIKDSHQLFTKYNKNVSGVDLWEAERLNYECLNTNKLSAKERRNMYPFNSASKISLVSFDARDSGYFESRLPIKNNLVDLSRMKEIQDLTEEEVDALTDILFNNGYRGEIFGVQGIGCYDPMNAILFYDSNGTVSEYIEICFKCHGNRRSSPKMSFGDSCSEKYDLLKDLFIKSHIELGTIKGPGIRENKK